MKKPASIGKSGGRRFRFAAVCAALAAMSMFAAFCASGCGGGGAAASNNTAAIPLTGPDGGSGGALTGRVMAPSAISLQRQAPGLATVSDQTSNQAPGLDQTSDPAAMLGLAGRSAAALGLVAKTTVPVFVYKINDDGAATTYWLASAVTNSSGDYQLTIPNGYAAGSNEIVASGSGSNLMRAFVTATGTINISPITEVVVARVVASDKPLANFSAAELIAMQTQANTDGASADYTGKATIADAASALYTGTLKTNLDAAITAAGAAARINGSLRKTGY